MVYYLYMPRTYRSAEVIQIAKISLRKLQWWCERGFIAHGRKGPRRTYTESQLGHIQVIANLTQAGVTLPDAVFIATELTSLDIAVVTAAGQILKKYNRRLKVGK